MLNVNGNPIYSKRSVSCPLNHIEFDGYRMDSSDFILKKKSWNEADINSVFDNQWHGEETFRLYNNKITIIINKKKRLMKLQGIVIISLMCTLKR